MSAHDPRSHITLHDAARLLEPEAVHDAEVRLAEAIEHGDLAASVKRWATEQWQGRQLPGNINRLETWIERAELERWAATAGG
jgi:hypothetical protein